MNNYNHIMQTFTLFCECGVDVGGKFLNKYIFLAKVPLMHSITEK